MMLLSQEEQSELPGRDCAFVESMVWLSSKDVKVLRGQ